jgi:hypothetical protein
MANTTLTFNFKLNVSLQVGDIVYYLNSSEEIKEIGPCVAISDYTITCDATSDVNELTDTSFIFFGKDNEINTSGLLGYYAEVTMKNSRTDYAELFAVNSEIFVSSN